LDKTQKEKQMGFLKRLFGTIEKVNKGEAPIEELDQAFVFDLEAEADDYWRQTEELLLINAVKAAGGPETENVLLFLPILRKIKKPLNSFIR